MENLFLIHRRHGEKIGEDLHDQENLLVWRTCLRQIGFSLSAGEGVKLQSQDETYEGVEAEKFLLEVICGLHSPIIGETEILGQFRQFLKEKAQHPIVIQLNSVFQKLLCETKKIRDTYLVGHGSSGYGSLTRRLTEDLPSAGFVGGGYLVQEILPWMNQAPEVHLFLRDPKKGLIFQDQHPQLICHSLEELRSYPDLKALMIAAPVSHEFLIETLSSRAPLEILIDFRGGQAGFNGHAFAKKFYDLAAFMALSEQQKDLRNTQKLLALQAVEDWKTQQLKKVQVRPFGWEDMCG